DISARTTLGRCLRTQGKLEEARQIYEDVIALEPDDSSHALRLVRLDLTEGRFGEAVRELDRLEQLEEEGLKDSIGRIRGRLAYRMGQPKYRLKLAREGLAAKEAKTLPLFRLIRKAGLVDALLDAGEEVDAKVIVDEMSALKGDNVEMMAAEVQGDWATYQEDADGLEAALDQTKEIASRMPFGGMLTSLNTVERARVDRFRGECKSALEKLDALLEDKPSKIRDWSYVEERMLCLLDLQRFTEAVELGRRFAAYDPGDADIYELLARAYDGAKKPREARKTYERLLELWANAEDDYKRMLDARAALLELSARSE
ncbi:MAG: tetratricopeptide repeat protein, partial [Nannocystaceae bacterium]